MQVIAKIKNKIQANAVIQRAQVNVFNVQPSGILYQRHPKLHATVSKYNYDYTYHLINGAFDYNSPIYPEYRQELDINDLTKLRYPNIHGNYNRFTDTQGGQSYADGWLQDHLTGIEYYYETTLRRWDTTINTIQSLNINGRTARPASISELHTLTNVGVYGVETFAHIPFFNIRIDINNIRIIAGCSLDMRNYPQGILGKVALSIDYGVIGYQANSVSANFMFSRRIEKPLNQY